jgi:hypothetical protein
VAAAAALLHLGRARAFLGHHDEGVAMLRAAAGTFDDAQTLVGSVEARARLAEICAFAGHLDAGLAALDEARELERDLGETPFTVLLDRVDLTLAVRSGDEPCAVAQVERSIARARSLGAKYDLLLLLALAERLGIADSARERAELADELAVIDLVALRGS